MTTGPIKVLVVDDHALVRKGVIGLLKSVPEIEVIAEASTGEEAIQMAQIYSPDVILMDIQMPGMGGLEAARKLLHINPNFKILALSMHENDLYPTRFLENGAAGYVTKNCGLDELSQAIRMVCAGQRYISPRIAQQLALKRFSNDSQSPFDRLSKRELQIVLMIIQEAKKTQEIAQILHLSPKTVNTYRYRIYDKLGVDSDVGMIRLALQHGLIDKVSK